MIIANMQVPSSNPLLPRLAAFVLGLLLAASVAYWVLHWPHQDAGRPLPPAAAADVAPAADPAALARLLGAESAMVMSPAGSDASNRFRLAGVIASGSGQGVALLSIDGKPPRPYRVGSTLEEGLVLQSVEPRRVALASDAQGPVRLRLELVPARP
jgi:general secretion pathway protein C